ncbi:hypothetical protein ABC382_00905 [Lysinibacillus sp. 1P01SD]|uniref:hypothetical protein n=1 Tax=Lysinibacillus sp. 1P01SD TaxID=3132285 RepID=UPI00399FA086
MLKLENVLEDMEKVNDYTSREKIDLTKVTINENEIHVSSASTVYVSLKKVQEANFENAISYKVYEEKFNALAFLWKSKIEAGLFKGTNDDIHLQKVILPLQSEIESVIIK